MRLPAHLREDLRLAYRSAYGRDLSAEDADALGIALVETFCFALDVRREAFHRSESAGIDDARDKRDREDT